MNQHSEQNFRMHSGMREFVFSFGRLLACVMTPLFLLKTNLNVVFIIFSMGCIINLLLIPMLNFKDNVALQLDKSICFNYQALTKPATWLYAMKLFPSCILVAFVALVASSDQLRFTQHITSYQHQMLWALEALMMMLGSFIYVRYKKIPRKYLEPLLILNAVVLVPLLWITGIAMLSVVIMLTSLLLYFSYYQFRDDYILSAGNSKQLIEIYSGFSIFFRDLLCTASPVLLSTLFVHYSLEVVITILFIFQFMFYMLVNVTRIQLRKRMLIVAS